MNTKSLFILCMILINWTSVTGEQETTDESALESREKRQLNALPLVFIYGAVLKFIIGLSVPIPIEDGIAVGFGANMQFQYSEVQNSSELSQYYFINSVSREQRALESDWEHRIDERLFFYKSLTTLIEAKGMNGNDCVMRAICEAAQYPVEEEGLVGEIIHILLTTILWIILLCIYSVKCDVEDNKSEGWREKRQINTLPLIYPYGGTYKLLVGFSLPVPMKEKISLAFAANFQYQYLQFQNISQLSQYYFINRISREQREASVKLKRNERLAFYTAFENLFLTRGLDGRECVLRAICEAAQFPVEEEGLFGEIMHILLTPDYGHTPFDSDPDWLNEIAPYRDAATAGRQMFDCPSIFSGCPEGRGVMEFVTKLTEE